MWDYDWTCDLYFEKAVSFMKVLFARWKEEKTRHQVTVVFFSRTCFDGMSILHTCTYGISKHSSMGRRLGHQAV